MLVDYWNNLFGDMPLLKIKRMSQPNPTFDYTDFPEDMELPDEGELADLKADDEFCERKLAEEEKLREMYPNLDRETI